MDFSLYKDYLHYDGETDYERNLNYYKWQFVDKAVKNPDYTNWDAKRNGVPQRFLIRRSEQYDRAILTTFPDEEICNGDYVEWNGLHWLVYETSDAKSFQKTALLWLCNLELKFQNHTSTVYSRWCVCDSGVYSTTLGGDVKIQFPDKQLNIYLPLDEDTKYIYIDKRLAIGKRFDKDGNEILDVYDVTSTDTESKNFGHGSHIMRLYLRQASNYNPKTDSLELLVCNVITQDAPQPTTEKYAKISGYNKVRLGKSIVFTGSYFDGDTEVEDVESVWEITPDIPFVETDDGIEIAIPKSDKYAGSIYNVSLSDVGGEYETATVSFEVEVM